MAKKRLKGGFSSVRPNKYMFKRRLILKGKKMLKIRIFSCQLKKYMLKEKNSKYILEGLMLKGKNWLLKVEDEDNLSRLPDEIVGSIMCWMTVKEAARMSVVSRRFQKIWKCTLPIMPRLTFNVDLKFAEQLHAAEAADYNFAKQLPSKKLRDFRDNCINEVYQVLKMHQAPTLDEFSLFATSLLSKVDSHHIKTWLDFAAKKHVKKLCLRLENPVSYDATFLAENFYCLRDLYISGLYMTENVINRLFSNSPFLERFSILRAGKLDKLKIISAPNLKYLEVSENMDLQHLEFSSEKNVLNTIKIIGAFGAFPIPSCNISSAPNLSHLILGIHCRHFKFDFYRALLKQIKRLTLQILVPTEDFVISDESLQFLRFGKFEHLELIMCPGFQVPIHRLLVLIKASRFLNTFSVEFEKFGHPAKFNGLKLLHKHTSNKVKNKVRKNKVREVNGKHSFLCLTVMKFNCFGGCLYEIEFVLHLLKYVSAEEIIIHLMPSSLWRKRERRWDDEDEFDNRYEELCLGCAQLLRTKILEMHGSANVSIKF